MYALINAFRVDKCDHNITGLICLQLHFTLVQHMPAIGIMQESMHHEISFCLQHMH